MSQRTLSAAEEMTKEIMSRKIMIPIWAGLSFAGVAVLALGGASVLGMRTALWAFAGVAFLFALGLYVSNHSLAISNRVGAPWMALLRDVWKHSFRRHTG